MPGLARKSWQGRPSQKAGPKDSTLRVPTQARPGDVPKSYQFWSQAVLLTYQGVQKDLAPGQTKTRPDRQTEGLRDRGTDRQRQRQTESCFSWRGFWLPERSTVPIVPLVLVLCSFPSSRLVFRVAGPIPNPPLPPLES